MHNFAYHRPSSVADAIKAIGAAADGKFVAGGQTLLPTLRQRLAEPSDVVDLTAIAELKGIKVEGDGITIGAPGTHASAFRMTTTCGATLAARRTCNITVTFVASGSGARTATLIVDDNASGSPHTAALKGTAR